MILELNKTKTCFWYREVLGLYRMGDIIVSQEWHSDGPFAGHNMWHVIVDRKNIVTWAYLKDAKIDAHKIDRHAKDINSIDDIKKLLGYQW